MNLNTCLQWLNTLHQRNHSASLTRFSEKLAQLKLYPKRPKIITVAGTNGKGTTCITLEAILLAAGYKTGCYLSPHLMTITERFRLNGQNVTDAEFCSAFKKAQSVYNTEETSWFEFITLVAMIIFDQHEIDFLVLEVGIGGKNDVVNAIAADVAIITSIALDHMEILGVNHEQIGAEKAGIFRAHKPAIYAELNPPESVLNYAKAISANLVVSGRDYYYEKKEDAGWFWHNQQNQSPLLPYPTFPIANAAAAIAGLLALAETSHISWEQIIHGLTQAYLPGRFQIIQRNPLMIVDVAHNPHAACYLAERLAQLPCVGSTYAIVGMQIKKDIVSTLVPMLNKVDQWYISNISEIGVDTLSFVDRAQACLQQAAAQFTVVDSISAGLALALNTAQAKDRIIIFGSFLVVEEVLKARCLTQ